MSKLSLSHFTFFEVFKCVAIMPEGNNNFVLLFIIYLIMIK